MLKSLLSFAACLVMFTATVRAEFQGFQKGDYTLSLSGSGASNDDDGTFLVQAQPSYFLSDNFEIALRQGVGYSDGWNGSTAVLAAYNFNLKNNLKNVVPYVGVVGTWQYGDSVIDGLFVGPEVGVRWFLNDSTFVFVNTQWKFEVEDFDNDNFVYNLGLGFRF